MTGHPELAYEQARNQEYLDKLSKKLARNPRARVLPNVMWIDAVDDRIRDAGYHHPLLGRVGCSTEDAEVRDFYIGSRFVQDDGIQVYSWAAPVASLFYQAEPDPTYDVVVRRTFAHHIDEIADVDDEWIHEVEQSPFAPRELSIPTPAARAPGRRRLVAPARTRTEDASSDELEVGPQEATDASQSSPTAQAGAPGRAVSSADGMRAAGAVLKRLAAPRQDRLLSVLALLQPDQHAMVSWPVDRSLVLQGHPGTGKTVVAAYRGAYLVNPELYEECGPLAHRNKPLRVLVVGPTDGYVRHVEGLIRPLAPADQVRVTHLAQLLIETTGLKSQWPGPIGGDHDDVDAQARRLAEQAARSLAASAKLKTGTGASRENIKQVYELIASNGSRVNPLTSDPEVIAWIRKLPRFDRAFRRRHLPLMAQCRLAYKPIPETDRYDHIIVDEAQDVSPIEWNVLDQYLGRDGVWTLVGDMNQRRSDTTYGSWQEIADHLALEEEGRFTAEVLERGYRSTGTILSFADQLLPARSRGNQTIQSGGPPVRVEWISQAAGLAPKAISVAAELAAVYPEGTSAIITVDPGAIMVELGRSGWRRPGAALTLWERDGRKVRLYVPEDARGLEFDAVVVVEPGAFPENLGRTGQLYTSLTRANRELAVVWHRGLPDPLRRAARN